MTVFYFSSFFLRQRKRQPCGSLRSAQPQGIKIGNAVAAAAAAAAAAKAARAAAAAERPQQQKYNYAQHQCAGWPRN